MMRRLRQPSALRVPNSRTRWATAARVSGLATANVASRRSGEFGRCFLYQGWYDLVPRLGLGLTWPGATPGTDQHHQQLE